MNVWARRSKNGFTIVELLIVIVVIAILATISVVAYNGVQNRAQKSLVQSETQSYSQKLEIFLLDSGDYPSSISDCPAPGADSLCLNQSSNTTILYENSSVSGGHAGRRLGPAFSLGLMTDRQFLYTGVGEREGINEFLQYVDLAPYIDKYGLRKYKLSFDIKSTNTSNRTTINTYFQNGSNSRYSISAVPVSVTESYTHKEIQTSPALASQTVDQAMLAFYGVYGTDNRPVVKNVKFQLAD